MSFGVLKLAEYYEPIVAVAISVVWSSAGSLEEDQEREKLRKLLERQHVAETEFAPPGSAFYRGNGSIPHTDMGKKIEVGRRVASAANMYLLAAPGSVDWLRTRDALRKAVAGVR